MSNQISKDDGDLKKIYFRTRTAISGLFGSKVVKPRPVERKLHISGRSYPLILPTLRDPRIYLALVIFSLQILGQVAFGFQLSIAQILVSLLTCAVLEFVITFRKYKVIMWPASALLTGNSVAFVLRVPGTEHGDWWSMHGWYIFAGTAAVALLSKYLIKYRGHHIFNPSNFGLVLCFILLGPIHADPLALWWGPMSIWLVLALVIIVVGGLIILSRLRLLVIALSFWLVFAFGIAIIAASGHAMTARWHLGPISGFEFWRLLVFSPEVLVFLFFMITDPKTSPSSQVGRRVYAVAIAVLASLLIAPQSTEFWTKVSLLGALAIVCAMRPIINILAPRLKLSKAIPGRSELGLLTVFGLIFFSGLLALTSLPARPDIAVAEPSQSNLSNSIPIKVLPSKGVASQISPSLASQISSDLILDFQAETDALINRNKTRAEAGTNGIYLLKLKQKIDMNSGNTYNVTSRKIESLEVYLDADVGQGAPLVIANVKGSQKQLSIQSNPTTVISTCCEEPFSQIFELRLYGSHYQIVGTRN